MIDDLKRELEQRVRITARRTSIQWEQEVKTGAPVGETGDLRRSVKMRDSQTSTGFQIVGVADTDYAEYVSTGTRPHVITPRTARRRVGNKFQGGVLAFKVGSVTVFATRVRHPGTDANDFWTRPLANLPETMQRIWRSLG